MIERLRCAATPLEVIPLSPTANAARHLRAALSALTIERDILNASIHDIEKAIARLGEDEAPDAPAPQPPPAGLPLPELPHGYYVESMRITQPRLYAEEAEKTPERGRPIGDLPEERPTIRQSILAEFREPDRMYSTQEIVESVGANAGWARNSVRSTLSKLTQEGELISHERGWYSLARRQLQGVGGDDGAANSTPSDMYSETSDGLGEGSRHEETGTPVAAEVPA